MKRADAGELSKEKIQQAALFEFSKHGYEGASMSHIAERAKISKGLIYHYFPSKEALYLFCVDCCIQELRQDLRPLLEQRRDVPSPLLLEDYFNIRLLFFQRKPEYVRLFAEAVITAPDGLQEKLHAILAPFRNFNRAYLLEILKHVSLRKDLSMERIARAMEYLQDMLNARFPLGDNSSLRDFEIHEEQCRFAIDIFLHGVVDR